MTRFIRITVLAISLSTATLALSGCDLFCLASTGHMNHLCQDARGNEIQCGCGR